MRGFGFLLAALALGHERWREPDRARGAPEQPYEPLDRAALAAWASWARRGDAVSLPDVSPAATGHVRSRPERSAT
jgi:hypothetical protein